jgi:hypothetical protein
MVYFQMIKTCWLPPPPPKKKWNFLKHETEKVMEKLQSWSQQAYDKERENMDFAYNPKSKFLDTHIAENIKWNVCEKS